MLITGSDHLNTVEMLSDFYVRASGGRVATTDTSKAFEVAPLRINVLINCKEIRGKVVISLLLTDTR